MNIRIRQHEIRVRFIFFDWRKPYWIVFLYGPNGSAAGWGPKGWPGPLRKWGGRIPMPQFTFAMAWKLRRLGRWVYALHSANQRFYRWLDHAL